MNYKYSKGKIIICKNGTYFALTDNEFKQLKELMADIESKQFYKKDVRR